MFFGRNQLIFPPKQVRCRFSLNLPLFGLGSSSKGLGTNVKLSTNKIARIHWSLDLRSSSKVTHSDSFAIPKWYGLGVNEKRERGSIMLSGVLGNGEWELIRSGELLLQQPPSLAGSYSYHLCDSCKVHDGGEFWIKKQQFCNTNNSTMWVG
jgi:hypothetical protein